MYRGVWGLPLCRETLVSWLTYKITVLSLVDKLIGLILNIHVFHSPPPPPPKKKSDQFFWLLNKFWQSIFPSFYETSPPDLNCWNERLSASWGPIKGFPETPRTSRYYGPEGFKGLSSCREVWNFWVFWNYFRFSVFWAF